MKNLHPVQMPGLSPQERLDFSRRAIFQNMVRHSHADNESRRENAGSGATAPRASALHRLWRTLRRASRAGWRSHPVHLVAERLQPVLGHCARAHPLALLGVATALGAGLVLVKPWRLIPVTGLLMATLKSKAFTQMIFSALTPERNSTRHAHFTQPRK